jgi:hypothetical protein
VLSAPAAQSRSRFVRHHLWVAVFCGQTNAVELLISNLAPNNGSDSSITLAGSFTQVKQEKMPRFNEKWSQVPES